MNERTTELIPLQNITKVPVAIFVGGDDIVANPTDGYWTAEQIGGAVIKYQIIDGGHLSFVVGKDMSWFTEDVIDIIKTYQPIS